MAASGILRHSDRRTPFRIADSVARGLDGGTDLERFWAWFRTTSEQNRLRTEQVPLEDLPSWHFEAGGGDLAHVSGRFFRVTGVRVHAPGSLVERWTQPILDQPEVGILGLLVKEFDGVLHCLVQGKDEPGNCNGVQLSPTVQATRSNYTRVHQGRPVPYLEHFVDPSRHHIIADVLQSEQGSWFYQKRNRNMVLEVDGDVEVREDFTWLPLGQLYQLLGHSDLVNMDTRTVLSCMPVAATGLADYLDSHGDDRRSAVARSCSGDAGSHSTYEEILSWITDTRSRSEVRAWPIPLKDVDTADWQYRDGQITNTAGRFFDVVGVGVEGQGREVASWDQPMLRPCGEGLAAFLVARIGAVLHVLVQARVAPGYVNNLELGPTVQCTPRNYEHAPAAGRPAFLDLVLDAPPGRRWFEATLSEEGGRFYSARTRYALVEVDHADVEPPPEYRWMTLAQLVSLLRHSDYVNVEARTLVACLQSLLSGPDGLP